MKVPVVVCMLEEEPEEFVENAKKPESRVRTLQARAIMMKHIMIKMDGAQAVFRPYTAPGKSRLKLCFLGLRIENANGASMEQ